MSKIHKTSMVFTIIVLVIILIFISGYIQKPKPKLTLEEVSPVKEKNS